MSTTESGSPSISSSIVNPTISSSGSSHSPDVPSKSLVAAATASPSSHGLIVEDPVLAAQNRLDALIKQQEKELENLKRLREEQANSANSERRKKILTLPEYLGVTNLTDVLTVVRNELAVDKGKRVAGPDKARVVAAIKNGATAGQIKANYGLSPATYYKIKKTLGMTRPSSAALKGMAKKSRSFRS